MIFLVRHALFTDSCFDQHIWCQTKLQIRPFSSTNGIMESNPRSMAVYTTQKRNAHQNLHLLPKKAIRRRFSYTSKLGKSIREHASPSHKFKQRLQKMNSTESNTTTTEIKELLNTAQ